MAEYAPALDEFPLPAREPEVAAPHKQAFRRYEDQLFPIPTQHLDDWA